MDFTRKVPLTGDLVTLEPVSTGHVSAIEPLLDDPEVAILTGTSHTSTPTAARPWTSAQLAETYARWATASDRLVWAIRENSTGRIVGESVLNDLDPGNRSCGFRIWIAGATGRGLGTEAVRLTMAHAFEVQQLHRVSLEVYAFNPRARHVYAKAGFRHEGTMREALRFDGGWVDAELMAMLRTDRPAP
ncbi:MULTISPECIES: GNAT family N-acetyltransferase [unclassified Pseudactinotalea]|uniref:GNAT family N-acetyltransferase n=1 Tax=unclassified Pseudactinotalea TaxID=2649176 RepID=UPI00128B5E91|nr:MULTISPECIES: GNAT family protein [unclassified Pseudactinotalea]MPV48776.1 GNAT family N-acetyltransferase [Pseudactinotalea sp. HY160]QGH68763.1 GNAT family N-acetyltransferase [Pseudactinotalea sp. HY158]